VNLLPNNEVKVRLAGAPNSFITLNITAVCGGCHPWSTSPRRRPARC
jgi:hypothetical protein